MFNLSLILILILKSFVNTVPVLDPMHFHHSILQV